MAAIELDNAPQSTSARRYGSSLQRVSRSRNID